MRLRASWLDWSGSRRSKNLGGSVVASGPAKALKGAASAGNVVPALAYAHPGALVVLDPWPAGTFVGAAQVLVATIPKTFR